MTSEKRGASIRLQEIQYAMRTGRWWEARKLLPDADQNEDWRALGFASRDEYLVIALTTRWGRYRARA